VNLTVVILRLGGEAQAVHARFTQLLASKRYELLGFLQSLDFFPLDDTASNSKLNNPSAPSFPQNGHGSIRFDRAAQQSRRSGIGSRERGVEMKNILRREEGRYA
jgi:hypothetical protein